MLVNNCEYCSYGLRMNVNNKSITYDKLPIFIH